MYDLYGSLYSLNVPCPTKRNIGEYYVHVAKYCFCFKSTETFEGHPDYWQRIEDKYFEKNEKLIIAEIRKIQHGWDNITSKIFMSYHLETKKV